MRCLRVYKLKDTYRYVSTNVPCASSYYDEPLVKKVTKHNNEKLLNNIVRSKTNVKNIAFCNDFSHFITITVNPKYDRTDLHSLIKRVNQKIRNIRFRDGCDIKYLLIPEFHRDNVSVHLHGLVGGDICKYMYKNKMGYGGCFLFDFIGYNSVSEINSYEAVCHYITKYITKDLKRLSKGTHSYYCSKGLLRPTLIDLKLYDNDYFDTHFFDFKNDYCYIKETKTQFPMSMLKPYN